MESGEKIYKTMSAAGVISLNAGIIVIVVGVVTGVMAIISDAMLLGKKRHIREVYLALPLRHRLRCYAESECQRFLSQSPSCSQFLDPVSDFHNSYLLFIYFLSRRKG